MMPDVERNAELTKQLLELEAERKAGKESQEETHLPNGWPKETKEKNGNAWLSDAINPDGLKK